MKSWEAREQSTSRTDVWIALSGAEIDWMLKALSSWRCRAISVEDLEDDKAIATLTQTAILFLPAFDSSRRIVTALVRRIRAVHTGLHISVCTSDPTRLGWPALARAGVDDVTLLFSDTEAQGLSRWVEDPLSLPVPEAAIEDLVRAFGQQVSTTIAAWCFRNATRPRSVATIGDWFGISPRTVQRRLDQAQLPQADTLLRCGRVLHAVELERAGVKPKVRIANRLGFSAAHDLWRAKATLRSEVIVNSRLASPVRKVHARCWVLPHEIAE